MIKERKVKNMNKAILLGRLTKDPDIRFSQNNNSKVARFTLAVDRKYTKVGEERQTDFINVVAFSKLAEFIEKYLHKGTQICLCGRIQTRVWTDTNSIKHYVTEIIAEEINFAGSKNGNELNTENESTTSAEDIEIIGDDDLPF